MPSPKTVRMNPERNFTHIRVRDPGEFDRRSFRVITLSPERGIKATIGCPAGEWDPRRKKCRVGTQIQKFLYPLGIKPSKETLTRNPKKFAQHVADIFHCPVAVPLNLKKEAAMYEQFHHKKPVSIVRASHPEIPQSLVALGKLESVIYKKFSDGMSYIHDLKRGTLAADRRGKLYIIGDKAKITERGILG